MGVYLGRALTLGQAEKLHQLEGQLSYLFDIDAHQIGPCVHTSAPRSNSTPDAYTDRSSKPGSSDTDASSCSSGGDSDSDTDSGGGDSQGSRARRWAARAVPAGCWRYSGSALCIDTTQ